MASAASTSTSSGHHGATLAWPVSDDSLEHDIINKAQSVHEKPPLLQVAPWLQLARTLLRSVRQFDGGAEAAEGSDNDDEEEDPLKEASQQQPASSSQSPDASSAIHSVVTVMLHVLPLLLHRRSDVRLQAIDVMAQVTNQLNANRLYNHHLSQTRSAWCAAA